MENTITLKLTAEQETKLFTTFEENQTKAPQYAKWQLRPENCVITCYESGKTVFQGKDANIYASPFQRNDNVVTKKPKASPSFKDTFPQAGSDEVGTGDYFGPVTVCASLVRESDMELLTKMGIRDSKQLKDEDIRKITPTIIKQIPHSLLIVNNAKYNEIHEDNNLNKMKARLHNQAYVNLAKKVDLPSFKIVDQFTPEYSYYRYIKEEPTIVRGIHFETKAENKYPSVAVSSIISRYAFLTYWDKMEEEYDMEFQKGAGEKVDACAKLFVERYGFEALKKVAKIHFKNTEKLKWKRNN